jgi:hypothetical protein
MHHHFFAHIDIDPKNVHILDGNAADLEAECARYEEEIRKVGGIELFLGGIPISDLVLMQVSVLTDTSPSMNQEAV